GDGWREFDIQREFYKEQAEQAEKAGHGIEDGRINGVALSLRPGPANTYWLDRIEVYLPG
ncbi:MAG: hypothetical protein JXR94_11485, partial [Candidatus Hydrogenedentes bacterium]|nr:hypothetical protein [Candidatus Hydrogenedentota bacterium]